MPSVFWEDCQNNKEIEKRSEKMSHWIVKCKRCGKFLQPHVKMCGKCGWTNKSSWINKNVTFVQMGKSHGVLQKYVIRAGAIVELLPARTHRQRRKFVASAKNRKTQKVR